MSSDSENEMSAASDFVNTATNVANKLLPQKSRSKYEKAYKDFMEWRTNKRTRSMSENVLLAYFEDLSYKFNPASLLTFHSMLKNTLNIRHEVDLAKYCKLTAFLKQKSEGYMAKKSKIFLPEEINKFLNEAPDLLYLQSKVGLIFGIMGACRRHELYNMKFNDVQVFDTTVVVTIRNTKPKTDRTFTITGGYRDLCKKYMDLRPSDCTESGFFLYYSAGKCTSQKIGLNKLGSLGKTIAIFLNLPDPEMYTGHCFRRTSEALLVNAGDNTTLKRQCGWKSTTIAEGNIDESIDKKLKVSHQILNSIRNEEVININMPSTSNQDPSSTTLQAGQLHISHCTTVNIYNHSDR